MNWKRTIKNWVVILSSGLGFYLFVGDGSEAIIVMILVGLFLYQRKTEQKYWELKFLNRKVFKYQNPIKSMKRSGLILGIMLVLFFGVLAVSYGFNILGFPSASSEQGISYDSEVCIFKNN